MVSVSSCQGFASRKGRDNGRNGSNEENDLMRRRGGNDPSDRWKNLGRKGRGSIRKLGLVQGRQPRAQRVQKGGKIEQGKTRVGGGSVCVGALQCS